MAIMMFSFVACEDKVYTSENNSSNIIIPSLVGTTWKYSEENDDYSTCWTLFFVSSSRVTMTIDYYPEDDHTSDTWTYSYTNGQGTIYGNTYSQSVQFRVNGNLLYFDDLDIGPFVKQ